MPSIRFSFTQICDLLDQPGLVYHVGKLRHDDLALAVWKRLDIGDGPDRDLAASCPVCLFNPAGS